MASRKRILERLSVEKDDSFPGAPGIN